MPLDLVPEVAVLIEGTSLGIKEAVGIDEVKNVGVPDFEVIAFGVHDQLVIEITWIPLLSGKLQTSCHSYSYQVMHLSTKRDTSPSKAM